MLVLGARTSVQPLSSLTLSLAVHSGGFTSLVAVRSTNAAWTNITFDVRYDIQPEPPSSNLFGSTPTANTIGIIWMVPVRSFIRPKIAWKQYNDFWNCEICAYSGIHIPRMIRIINRMAIMSPVVFRKNSIAFSMFLFIYYDASVAIGAIRKRL